MEIILYQNNSPSNFITKSLVNEIKLNGALREQSSIIDPEILIAAGNISRYNYMYIAEFKRFYYINDLTSVRNGLWRVKGHVDVLNTYRSEIKGHQAIISKQERTGNSELYFDDSSFIVKNQKYIQTITFPSGLNQNGEYILITAGATV